jgi:hypothetical protein
MASYMNPDREKILELLERRLELVRALIRLGAQWRRAFIDWNLDHSEQCASEEEKLSRQVLALDIEIASHGPRPVPCSEQDVASLSASAAERAEMDWHTDRKIREVLDRMRALHLELKLSNDIRKAILNRSKITMTALRNLFNSHAPTYAAPTAASTGTIYEERV